MWGGDLAAKNALAHGAKRTPHRDSGRGKKKRLVSDPAKPNKVLELESELDRDGQELSYGLPALEPQHIDLIGAFATHVVASTKRKDLGDPPSGGPEHLQEQPKLDLGGLGKKPQVFLSGDVRISPLIEKVLDPLFGIAYEALSRNRFFVLFHTATL